MNCCTSKEIALVESLVGKTIVRAEIHDDCNGYKWCNHQYVYLWLDDGRKIYLGGQGHDSSQLIIEEENVMVELLTKLKSLAGEVTDHDLCNIMLQHVNGSWMYYNGMYYFSTSNGRTLTILDPQPSVDDIAACEWKREEESFQEFVARKSQVPPKVELESNLTVEQKAFVSTANKAFGEPTEPALQALASKLGISKETVEQIERKSQ
jgi:hypothetical protein